MSINKFLNIKLLETVGMVSINAGKAVMDVYKEDFQVEEKSPNHPVTKADMISHTIIKNSLENLLPDTFFFSEESEEISWQERQKWKNYWLVDPLDGTKEFIKRNGEFTINIALINEFKPILGVVYAPYTSKIYLAATGYGAYLKNATVREKFLSLDDNCKLKKVNTFEKLDELRVVSSRSHKNNEKMKKWLSLQNKYRLIYSGSSIKFCLIAEGIVDIYPRFRPTSEWDTAAGHCILKESGGNIRDLNGNEITYNKVNILNPDFIASDN